MSMPTSQVPSPNDVAGGGGSGGGWASGCGRGPGSGCGSGKVPAPVVVPAAGVAGLTAAAGLMGAPRLRRRAGSPAHCCSSRRAGRAPARPAHAPLRSAAHRARRDRAGRLVAHHLALLRAAAADCKRRGDSGDGQRSRSHAATITAARAATPPEATTETASTCPELATASAVLVRSPRRGRVSLKQASRLAKRRASSRASFQAAEPRVTLPARRPAQPQTREAGNPYPQRAGPLSEPGLPFYAGRDGRCRRAWPRLLAASRQSGGARPLSSEPGAAGWPVRVGAAARVSVYRWVSPRWGPGGRGLVGRGLVGWVGAARGGSSRFRL